MADRQTTDEEFDALGAAIERHPPGVGRGCNLCAAATQRAEQAEAHNAELAAALREHLDKLAALARSFEVSADKEAHDRTAIAYGDACRCIEALCDKVGPVLARTPAAAAERVAAMEARAREADRIQESIEALRSRAQRENKPGAPHYCRGLDDVLYVLAGCLDAAGGGKP